MYICYVMSSNSKNIGRDFIIGIATIIGLAFLWIIISRFINDLKKSTSSDIISEEGKKILSNPKQRIKLREAVNHYHQTGSWEKLDEVSG